MAYDAELPLGRGAVAEAVGLLGFLAELPDDEDLSAHLVDASRTRLIEDLGIACPASCRTLEREQQNRLSEFERLIAEAEGAIRAAAEGSDDSAALEAPFANLRAAAALGPLAPRTQRLYDGLAVRIRGTRRIHQGHLSPEQISCVVRAHAPAFRNCLEAAARRRPGHFSVRLIVDWQIALSGRVVQARIASATTTDAELTSCMLAAVGRMLFTRPRGGTVRVSFPFVGIAPAR